MMCRLNLTKREPPKQLNPINMIPPTSSSIKLLNTLVLELAQVIINTREDGRLYTISNLLIIEELHLQFSPMRLC